MVMPRFVAAAMSGEPLRVNGTGEQTRCFCHVSDVVDAVLKLIETPAAVGRVFNLGGEEEISMNALAERVIELADSLSQIEHISYEEAYGHQFEDMARRMPKLDRLREAISFRQAVPLDEIIRGLIADYSPSGAKETQPGKTQPGKTQLGNTQPGNTQPSDVQPSNVRSSDVQPSDA